jgi:hypothetical protein
MQDASKNTSVAVLHALANELNTISIAVQIQERYLAKNSPETFQLLAETTKNLKHGTQHLQTLLEHLRQALTQADNQTAEQNQSPAPTPQDATARP